MKVWKLTAANRLVKSEENVRPCPGKLRVRVTKIFVDREDSFVFSGRRKVKYPLIPGRYAVGLIADDNGGARFPKNTRVLLHHFLPAVDTGSAEKTFSEDDFRILGETDDGFMRDFVYVTPDEITLLPEAVNDEKALLLPQVALAKAAVEALNVQRGQHIAVIGGGRLGIFISRLLIYQQSAPLLIDSDRERLDFARSRGVYYTSLNDEHLLSVVGNITGGRLADAVVYTPVSDELKDLPLKVCAAEKHIAYVGETLDPLGLDVGEIVKKRLVIHGLSDGTDYLENAINLVANKAIDLTAYRFLTTPADRADTLFESLSSRPSEPIDEMNIISLI